MRHVEERSRCIPLNPHVFRLGKPRQGAQSSRAGDFGLVIFLRRQVRDTSNSIALDLDVGRHHLANEGVQPAELNNQDFIVG
jgi:hypothetical protein